MNARVEGGAEQRLDHLFTYGEGRHVRRVMGGKSCTGRPRLAALLWIRETKRSRIPFGE